MADKSRQVEVLGLRELSAAFKAMDADLHRDFKAGLKRIADKVVGKVQQKLPWNSGSAARSVKARASARGASIAFGGTAAPHYPWLDFGGSVGRGHVSGQAWSGAIKRDWQGVPTGSGRYIYPTISEEGQTIRDDVEDLIKRTAQAQSFEVRG